MALLDVTLFQTLRAKMDWHAKRQGVLAQNVANSDTPNYRARDLAKFEVNVVDPSQNSVQIRATHIGHIGVGQNVAGQASGSMQDSATRSFEVRPSGNAISSEEQMAKMSENAMGYQANAAMMQKVIGMYRMALGRR